MLYDNSSSDSISFSQMKMIKSRLRNRLGEKGLSYLMKIAIESTKNLSDEDF